MTGLRMDVRVSPDGLRQTVQSGENELRVEEAKAFINKRRNVLVDMKIIETASNSSIAIRPLWIAGPNAAGNELAAENKDVLRRLLELVGEDTDGGVDLDKSVPRLVGLSFNARFSVEQDRTGRSHNRIITVYPERP